MSSAFVPLAEFLRPALGEPAVEAEPRPVERSVAQESREYDEALRAARRFRAALDDALEAGVEELLTRIARDVLARELQLEAADVGAIVAAARVRLQAERVLAIRVHPNDAAALESFAGEIVADRALERGDVRIELRSGTIDLTLAARLEAAVAASR